MPRSLSASTIAASQSSSVIDEYASDSSSDPFIVFLRKMSKKGFYPLLVYINEEGQVGYNDALKYALSNKIVDSRSTVTVVLNTLTDLKIVERTVSGERPIRTTYRLSKKGKNILPLLKQIQREF